MKISKEIILQCDIAWQEKLLELLDLKIGDVVDCSFHYYTGSAKQCFMGLKVGKGVIVKTDKGIFVKSEHRYPQAHEKRRYPLRPTPTYWHFEDEYVFSDLSNIEIELKDS